MEKVTEIVSN